MRFIYNLNEKKTPAGKGMAFGGMTANPKPQLDYHLKNRAKLAEIVPQTRVEAKQLEAEIWMCEEKIAYWTRRVAKKKAA